MFEYMRVAVERIVAHTAIPPRLKFRVVCAFYCADVHRDYDLLETELKRHSQIVPLLVDDQRVEAKSHLLNQQNALQCIEGFAEVYLQEKTTMIVRMFVYSYIDVLSSHRYPESCKEHTELLESILFSRDDEAVVGKEKKTDSINLWCKRMIAIYKRILHSEEDEDEKCNTFRLDIMRAVDLTNNEDGDLEDPSVWWFSNTEDAKRYRKVIEYALSMYNREPFGGTGDVRRQALVTNLFHDG